MNLRARPFLAALWATRYLVPLAFRLRVLRWLSRRTRPHESTQWFVDFATAALGLEGAARLDWYRRLWWGREAAQVFDNRLYRKDQRGIERFIGEVDWEPCERALAEKRGVLFIGAHMGPHSLGRVAFVEHCRDSLLIERFLPIHGEGISVGGDPTERGGALAKAVFHLRRGGAVALAGDGEFGKQSMTVQFLGCPIALRRGPAALARVSRAVTLLGTPIWKGERVIAHWGPRLEPRAPRTDPDAWDREWLEGFVAWIEDRILRGAPEDLRMKGGIWTLLRAVPLAQIRRVAPRDASTG